MKILNKET